MLEGAAASIPGARAYLRSVPRAPGTPGTLPSPEAVLAPPLPGVPSLHLASNPRAEPLERGKNVCRSVRNAFVGRPGSLTRSDAAVENLALTLPASQNPVFAYHWFFSVWLCGQWLLFPGQLLGEGAGEIRGIWLAFQ